VFVSLTSRRSLSPPVTAQIQSIRRRLAHWLGAPLLCLVSIPAMVGATQPPVDAGGLEQQGAVGPRGGAPEWPTERVNYLFEFEQIVQFLALWQETDPGPNFGGMIEAEGGSLGNVIQTDNTLEAIWVWSRYTAITGRTTYLQNIADAWTYCQAWPAWNEEGGTNGNYRVHNCAWGLAAESAYRLATGDTAFLTYAQTCADWIVNHPLFINQNQAINAFVEGWAAGNLYLYGEERNNAAWMASALSLATTVKTFIDVDPVRNLALETWAMSSGTMVWGLCNSTFRDDPAAGIAWLAVNGARVDTFQPWYDVPNDSFDWDNSWNVAYANAHFAMYDLTGEPAYHQNAVNLTNLLLAYDEDDDGGIQGTTQDPVTEDMSWVTCYLTKFGVDRLLGTPPSIDAGVLAFASPEDQALYVLPLGAPIPIEVTVTNYGLADLTGVSVQLEGAIELSTTLDLPYAARPTLTLDPSWSPGAGQYELTVSTSVPGDENPSNDQLTIQITVLAPSDVASDLTGAPRVTISPNPSRGDAVIRLVGRALTPTVLSLHDAAGRLVRRFELPGAPSGSLDAPSALRWDGRDARGRTLPPGAYWLRDTRRAGAASRIVRLR